MVLQPETAEVTTAHCASWRVLPWLLLSVSVHLFILYWVAVNSTTPSRQWQALEIVLIEKDETHSNIKQHESIEPNNHRLQQRPAKPTIPSHRQSKIAPTKKEHHTAGETSHSTAETERTDTPNVSTTSPANRMMTSAETPAEVEAPENTTTIPSHSAARVRPKQQATDTIVADIKLALARHFHYPVMAKRRGWQGEVILSFELQVDGTITNIRIAQSSGYSVLDQAALSALGRVNSIKSSLNRDLAMQLPVIYRLREG